MSKAIPAGDIFRWLRQVQADRDLPDTAFRAAFVISQRIDREKGYAHPSCEYLAKETGTDERTVRRAVNRLIACGHIEAAERRGGRSKANEYVIRLKDEHGSSSPTTGGPTPETRTPAPA